MQFPERACTVKRWGRGWRPRSPGLREEEEPFKLRLNRMVAARNGGVLRAGEGLVSRVQRCWEGPGQGGLRGSVRSPFIGGGAPLRGAGTRKGLEVGRGDDAQKFG